MRRSFYGLFVLLSIFLFYAILAEYDEQDVSNIYSYFGLHQECPYGGVEFSQEISPEKRAAFIRQLETIARDRDVLITCVENFVHESDGAPTMTRCYAAGSDE